MTRGQCDCCGANDVELAFSIAYGIETWSCAEGCDTFTEEAQRRIAVVDEAIASAHAKHGK